MCHSPFASTSTMKDQNIMSKDDTQIREICPGVEYLVDQNKTQYTVLQVNASYCHGKLPPFTAHSGVVYTVCNDSDTFCLMRVEFRPQMYVGVYLQRLEYWCHSAFWRTRMTFRTSQGSVRMASSSCNTHSLSERTFHALGRVMDVEHNGIPLIRLDFYQLKRPHVIIQYVMGYSAYVIMPYIYPKRELWSKELRGPYGYIIMVSAVHFTTYAADLKVKYTTNNTSRQRIEDVSFAFFSKACIFPITCLHIFFKEHYAHTKLLFSAFPVQDQLCKLSSGLFNCSVVHYSNFKDHLHCNLRSECEDGQDETEHCAFSSPDCYGLVASVRKCFKLAKKSTVKNFYSREYFCAKEGGQLVSVKTRTEQDDLSHIVKQFSYFWIRVNYVSGWYSGPFMYSKFRKWLDKTCIYNMNHFTAGYYHPSRQIRVGVLEPMGLYTEKFHTKYDRYPVICETELSKAFQSKTVSVFAHSFRRILTQTRQSFVVCLDGHIIHKFMLCSVKNDYGKELYTHLYLLMNVTNNFQSLTGRSRNMSVHSTAVFKCDDDVTTADYTFICDFRQDCPDNSDESFCEHLSCNGFLCSNAQCVKHSQRCNEYSNCFDDSDEVNCSVAEEYHSTAKPTVKMQPYYVSLDGTGYFIQEVMKDDDQCPDSHFQCTAEWLYCLPVYTRCNGFSDCVYGEDEQNCGTVTCPYYYQCKGTKLCLHEDHLCDGWGQCPQYDDEVTCDMTCPEGCTCQGYSFLCSKPFTAEYFPKLRYVDATGSGMWLSDFARNVYLNHLSLSRCSLNNVSGLEIRNLQFIDLSKNHLKTLYLTAVLDLPNLRIACLKGNPLQQITNRQVKHIHYELRKIDLSKCHLENIETAIFKHFLYATYMNISYSGIQIIGPKGFKIMRHLVELDIKSNPLTKFPMDLFARSYHLKTIYSSDYRFCCDILLPRHRKKRTCSSDHVLFPSCSTLIPSALYSVFFWMVSIFAISGNLICPFTLSFVKELFESKFIMTIAQLQIADICMGIHVAIVVVASDLLNGEYIWLEKIWIKSVTCKLSGWLFLLSKEVSVFVILFVTLNHTFVICIPKYSHVFHRKSSVRIYVLIWLMGIVLSLIPFFPGLSHWGLSGQSGLCRLALFQHRSFRQNFRWFNAMVAINCMTCLIVIACHFVLYRNIPKYTILLDPTKQFVSSCSQLTRKVSVLETVCSYLLGIVIVMATYGVAGSDKIRDTFIVFMLPLNSALNPLFCMWTSLTQKRKKTQEYKMLKVLKSRLGATSKI